MSAQSSFPDPIFGHVATAMVTPFDDNLQIDERQIVRLIDHLVENGTETLVVCGTTGESATLSRDEKVKMFTLVKKHAEGRAKIIAGVGTNNTADSIRLAKQAQEIGVDGHLLITPYYNKPSQEGLFQHFSAIARETSLPIMLYNVPPRTSLNMTAATTVRCARECPNIVAVKEASKDMEQIGEIARTAPAGFQIYSGDDGVTLPMLALGSVGVVSVISHVAGKALRQMHSAFFNCDLQAAAGIHLSTLPLTKALFCTTNPVPVKYAMQRMGVLTSDHVRLPLVPATAEEREIVDRSLTAFGLI